MIFTSPVHTVYKTTNLVNEKFYIGYHKTKNLHDSYLGSGRVLGYSITKYGKENFKKETLFIFDTAEEAYTKEYELVEESRKDVSCMNITAGGRGAKPTEAIKARLSKLYKGKPQSKEWRAKRLGHLVSEETRKKISEGRRGIKYSEETRLKMKEIHKGKIISEEARVKISDALRGRPAHNKGKKASLETGRKISEAIKGHEVSEETRRKIGEANKQKPGRVWSDESRLKLSQAIKGRVVSNETRRKISEAKKKKLTQLEVA